MRINGWEVEDGTGRCAFPHLLSSIFRLQSLINSPTINLLASVLRHVMVDLIRPRANAAADALGVFEALFLEELHGFHRANPALAMHVEGLVRIQVGEALRQRVERN